MKYGLLFDLDGVLVDTAKYHYLAWKKLADQLEIPFDEKDNERLKGVSRIQSLNIILNLGKREMTEGEKEACCREKNKIYLSYINTITDDELLPGVKEFLIDAREKGHKIALGSASKNARLILERLDLVRFFDAIVDGNLVAKAKPDPEVFVMGAEMLGKKPAECIVFEDSNAGIEAAHAGNMKAVGMGTATYLAEADICLKNLKENSIDDIIRLLWL